MAIMLNSRSNVYENIFSSASQPPDSSTLLQPAGIAGAAVALHRPGVSEGGEPAHVGLMKEWTRKWNRTVAFR